jgi:hypothetical protein
MDDANDLHWCAAVDADAIGEASEDQRRLLARYVPRGRPQRLERRLLAELRAAGRRLLPIASRQ